MNVESLARPRILGTALGNPDLPSTYSGVPYHCFAQNAVDGRAGWYG